MKKRIFVLIIALTVLCSTFVGCGQKKQPTVQSPTNVLLSGFTCVDELRTFKFASYFNKAEINRDKQYITEGDTSAKFTLDGERGGIPQVDVFMGTEFNPFKDFTKVRALSVDIFNADDKTHVVQIGFTTRKSGNDRMAYSPVEFTLQQGYNKVIMELDRVVAKNVCYIDKVEYVSMIFENGHDDPYVMYVDNLRAHLTDEPVEETKKVFKENELLFFDDKMDRYFLTYNNVIGPATLADDPKLSINRNPAYIKSGTGSLKMTVAVNPLRNDYASAGIAIYGEPISRIDLTKYSKIRFRVMSDTTLGVGSNFNTAVYDSVGTCHGSIAHLRDEGNVAKGLDYIPWGQSIPADTWFTLEIDLSEIIALDGVQVESVVFYTGTLTSGTPYSWYLDEITLLP